MRQCVRGVSLVILLLAVTASPGVAQLRGGLVGGATYSKLTGDFIASSDYKWNWFAGAYLELMYGRNWSLLAELDYVRKGGKAVTDNAQNIDLAVGYVEVPVLANFAIPVSSNWEAGLYGGASIGVPVTCDVAIEGSEVSCSSGLSSSKTEWTLPVGGRIGFRLSGGSTLMADVRYAIPLSEALERESIRIMTWHLLLRWSTLL